MSYATENWLRKQLRTHQQALARAADLLKRVKDDKPWTTREVDTVLEEAEIARKAAI